MSGTITHSEQLVERLAQAEKVVDENIIRNQGALIIIAEELRNDLNRLAMRVYLIVEEKESLAKRLDAFEKMLRGVQA